MIMKTTETDNLLPEYDFSKAERGKHYRPLHKGYTVHVHKKDGTTVVNHYKLEKGTVLLEPDVRAYFPDSESVNAALRSLIQLIAEMPHTDKPYIKRTVSARQVAERK
jgi:hypothetical protein